MGSGGRDALVLLGSMTRRGRRLWLGAIRRAVCAWVGGCGCVVSFEPCRTYS